MRLAEALALRADATRRAEQLRARIAASARYQEGETPGEDTGQAVVQEAARRALIRWDQQVRHDDVVVDFTPQ